MLAVGRIDGKVVFITGAARGQGRSHALRLAEEGADIIAVDIATPRIPGVNYELGTNDDLNETGRLVKDLGRRVVTAKADVRNQAELDAAVRAGVEEFGHIDIVAANAGIMSAAVSWEMDDETWHTTLDINLTGVWRTCKAVIPQMIAQGTGGSIVVTSSTAFRQGIPNISHYVASKHGAVGLVRSLANELGPHGIRVNSVAPTCVATKMLLNDSTKKVFDPDRPLSQDEMGEIYKPLHILDSGFVDPVDVSNAVLYLSSDEGRFVTGSVLEVDLGFHAKFAGA